LVSHPIIGGEELAMWIETPPSSYSPGVHVRILSDEQLISSRVELQILMKSHALYLESLMSSPSMGHAWI